MSKTKAESQYLNRVAELFLSCLFGSEELFERNLVPLQGVPRYGFIQHAPDLGRYYWAKEALEKYGLDMIYAETQEEADALNAKYKPKIPYVTGVVYYAEPIDGVEHKPALSRFYEAAKSPD